MTTSPFAPDYVVDSSVALKWFSYRDEPDLRQARNLREAYIDGRCILRAPDLLLLELANALKAGLRLRASEVLQVLVDFRGLAIRLEAFRWSTLAKAVEIASASDATVYDSYFLALALESNSVLVTADEAFLRKTRRYPSIISLRRLRIPD